MPYREPENFDRHVEPRGEDLAAVPGRVGRARIFTPRWPAPKGDPRPPRWRSLAHARAIADVERAPLLSEETARLYFWPRVDKVSAPDHPTRGRCWLWTGRPGVGGYGYFSIHGAPLRAHRYALEVTRGPIGDLFACHLCSVPLCSNPAHLYSGDPQSNADDARQVRAQRIADLARDTARCRPVLA